MPAVPQLHDLALARHAAHCGEHAAGLRACERLLARGLPPKIEAEVRAARTWYIPSLDDVLALTGARVHRSRIECEPARPGWTLFNPTCLEDRQGGLYVLVRSSNYHIAPDGSYVVPPEDQGERGIWIRTRHILLHYRNAAVAGDAIHLIGPDWDENDCQITGMEDIRLRWGANGRIVASGTVLNPASLPKADNGWPIARIATATLLPDAGILCDFDVQPEPIAGRYEKNWVPIEGMPTTWLYAANEDGHVATVSRPHTVNLDGLPGEPFMVQRGWEIRPQALSLPALRHLRGRSQLVDVGLGRRLGIFGEATDDGRRMYDHRFVLFDGITLKPMGWSKPFRFGPLRGVEFCAGLARVGNTLFATYGLRDEEAWIATMSMHPVLESLEPIPS